MKIPGWKNVIIYCFTIWSSLLFGEILYAQPSVRILMHPDRPSISLGLGRKEISFTARANGDIKKYQWTLDGPGELKGNTNSPMMYYILPKRLAGDSAQVVVSVTIIDVKGQKAEAHRTFSLASPKDFELLVKTNKKKYKPGDELIVSVKANQDCYFRLILQDAEGKEALLFPLKPQEKDFLKAGLWFRLPRPESDFKWEMTEPFGTETVIAEARTDPFPEEEDSEAKSLSELFQKTEDSEAKGVVRLPVAKESRAVARYEIVP